MTGYRSWKVQMLKSSAVTPQLKSGKNWAPPVSTVGDSSAVGSLKTISLYETSGLFPFTLKSRAKASNRGTSFAQILFIGVGLWRSYPVRGW